MFEFFTTPYGKIIISIILGLGLSTIFRKSCHTENNQTHECIEYVFKGGNPNSIQKKIFKYTNNKCYKYKPYLVNCNNKNKIYTV